MQVLHKLPKQVSDELIVGVETSDDAAVYRLSDDMSLVTSLDFFPPMVDEARTFGRISAANALSDIYAMGGTPRLAMNIVCFPKKIPLDILEEILQGSCEKLEEAGVVMAGGHTIEDEEVKYGLSVTGFMNPNDVIKNKGAKVGDKLILTKPLGSGIICSALKDTRITEDDVKTVIASMEKLNNHVALAMNKHGVNACTDITGFGFLGHAFEMAQNSLVSFDFVAYKIPLFADAIKFSTKKSCLPKAIETNFEYCRDALKLSDKIEKGMKNILLDPQTSGGILISVDKDKADNLLEDLIKYDPSSAIVGEVKDLTEGKTILKVT